MPRNAASYAAAVKRRLSSIPGPVRREIGRAQGQNADALVALAQSLAPRLKTRSSKRQPGDLARSIHKEPGDTELSVKVVAGDSKVFYARFVEFGTRASVKGQVQAFAEKLTLARGAEVQGRSRKARRIHPGTKAQPFFFPAYRALKKGMRSRVTRAATRGLKEGAGA